MPQTVQPPGWGIWLAIVFFQFLFKIGLAYQSLCGNKAQSVSKDRGLMTAVTAAHELAHKWV